MRWENLIAFLYHFLMKSKVLDTNGGVSRFENIHRDYIIIFTHILISYILRFSGRFFHCCVFMSIDLSQIQTSV